MKTIPKLSLIPTVLWLGGFLCAARADTIAHWTFETSYQPSAVTGTNSAFLAPDSGPVGSLLWGVHADAGSSFDDVTGNGSAHALTANRWNIGDSFEFQTATAGFTNISLSFDQYRSGTGPADWALEYSTDGSTFVTLQDYVVASSPTWSATTYRSAYTFSFDLASAAPLADSAQVRFRLAADSSPSSTAGASRVDNIVLLGDPIPVPEPAALLLAGFGGALLLLRRFGCQRRHGERG